MCILFMRSLGVFILTILNIAMSVYSVDISSTFSQLHSVINSWVLVLLCLFITNLAALFKIACSLFMYFELVPPHIGIKYVSLLISNPLINSFLVYLFKYI